MEMPLVTISIITYNQEKYVREAVRGLLSQTYEPLEIVISDDHSTDRTWDIILEEVEAYNKSGGIHKNIVLNRNEKNLGISKHFEKMLKLAHGELLIGGAGDDASMPNRVARVVEVWLQNGKPLAVIHDAYKIDESGAIMGKVGRRSWDLPLGAVTSYSAELYAIKGLRINGGCAEDHIYTPLAAILGRIHVFDDVLLKYRIGSGVSSYITNMREAQLRNMKMIINSGNCLLENMPLLKDKIESKEFDDWNVKIRNRIGKAKDTIDLFSGDSIAIRARAFRKLSPKIGSPVWFQYVILLFCSGKVGDCLLSTYNRLNYLRKRVANVNQK